MQYEQLHTVQNYSIQAILYRFGIGMRVKTLPRSLAFLNLNPDTVFRKSFGLVKFYHKNLSDACPLEWRI